MDFVEAKDLLTKHHVYYSISKRIYTLKSRISSFSLTDIKKAFDRVDKKILALK
jgi:hypothetical protein